MNWTESEPRKVGWSDLVAGKNAARVVALAGGVALYAINVYIATSILPSVVADIGGLGYYAWNTTIFVVASIVASALAAKLMLRAGPRGAYATAALVFMAGTAVCAAAPSMPMMLVGRLIQGAGGGFLSALSYVMIRVIFEEALWPRAIALMSGMWGVATLVGPAVGGVFAQMHAWRWAFGSLFFVSALFTCIAWFVLPGRVAEPPRESGSLPLPQLILLAASVLAVSIGSVHPSIPWNAAGVAVAVALAVLLVRIESRSPSRLLPEGALRPSATLGAAYATMALLVAVMNCEIFVPYFVQTLHGQTPLVAGYIGALMAAGWTTGSLVSSSWTDRRAHGAIVASPMIVAAAMVVLSFLAPIPSGGAPAILIPVCMGLAFLGFGIGFGWPHLVTRVLRSAREGDQEVAAASITTIQSFAMALGAAVAGMVANLAGFTDPGGSIGARHAAAAVFGGLAIVPVAATFMAVHVVRTARSSPR